MYRVNLGNGFVEHLPDAKHVGAKMVEYRLQLGSSITRPIRERADSAYNSWVDTKDEARALVVSIITKQLLKTAGVLEVAARQFESLETLKAGMSQAEFNALTALLGIGKEQYT